jgi:hypothetical protein
MGNRLSGFRLPLNRSSGFGFASFPITQLKLGANETPECPKDLTPWSFEMRVEPS